MSAETHIKILVACLGNPDRADDGIGALTANELRKDLPPSMTLLCRHGDMAALIEDMEGFDALICVDASAPAGEPGRIHRIDAKSDALIWATFQPSSHDFGVWEAISLARELGRAPAEIILYAVEGQCFEIGAAMTPEVAASAGRVATLVLAEAERLRRNSWPSAEPSAHRPAFESA